MMPTHHWARNFNVDRQDIEYLTSLLLEKEIPLDTEALARALIGERLRQEAAALKERYRDARRYNPAQTYAMGEKLIFPVFDFETGVVVNIRPGNNQGYGPFEVIGVKFDSDHLNHQGQPREFAINLRTSHKLSQSDANGGDNGLGLSELTVDEVLNVARADILGKLESGLKGSPDLIHMARKWFPRELMLDVNVGHLNLAEAVLDLSEGGPLSTEAILKDIGGLGKAPVDLQIFSMNHALNQDERFDEVGPTGEVLWFLTRLEPQEVRHTPGMLRYSPIEYDPHLLSEEMLALESEIGDELSPLDAPEEAAGQATVTLIYPHRRLGTLPLNNQTVSIFPTARQTPRVWVTLVDGQDGEEYPCWVVRKERYVFGLAAFYRKHRLPIGAYVTISRSETSDQILINYNAYRPRTEWIRLIVPQHDQVGFENNKRAIGAEYDELMILGADDLAAVDALFQTTQQQKKSVYSILRAIIPPLGALAPQGTVHARTLYSAVNVLRRCPPGPILATLAANPDFQNVGGHYWKLRTD